MQKIRVLLADDHEIVRYGLSNLIDGCEDIDVVAEAGSGKQALKLYKEHQPDVGILDITMPDIDGVETARQIIEHDPEASIIILTMHNGFDYLKKGLKVGVDGYIMKNTKADELVSAIRKVSDGHKVFSDEVSDMLSQSFVESETHNDALTARESEITALIAEGNTTAEIARLLIISPRTVEAHRRNVMKKIGAKNTAELVRYAVKHNLSSS